MCTNKPLNLISSNELLGEDTPLLAQFLLGKIIEVNNGKEVLKALIVETEAYKAPMDKASHAYGNKRTKRTQTMFEAPGTAYIYLCYGIHNMLNIVTGPKEIAHAVLIRAIEPLSEIEIMSKNRHIKPSPSLTNGPGKLCQALGINKTHNGKNVTSKSSTLKLYHYRNIDKHNIVKGPRVGISYAKEWAHKEWRFYIKDNKYVSKPKAVSYL